VHFGYEVYAKPDGNVHFGYEVHALGRACLARGYAARTLVGPQP
jgi:hypothetical protein